MPKLAGDFLGSSSLVGSGQICLLARAMVFENIRLPWHQTGTTDWVWAWWPLSLLRNQVLPEKWPTSLFDIMIPSSESSGLKLFETKRRPSEGLAEWTAAVWNRMMAERGKRRIMFGAFCSSTYCRFTFGSFIFVSKCPLTFPYLKFLKGI